MSKKRGDDGGGGDSWLNTYADMVTLLLTFFAVLLSMSNTDEQKFNAFIKSISNIPQENLEEIISAIGDSPTGDINAVNPSDDEIEIDEMTALFNSLTEYVESHNQSDAVSVEMVDQVIYIRFNSALFFEPDRYVLLQDSLPTLSFIGDALKQTEEQIKMVNVIGHTATVDHGTYWMLSGERAATVVSYLNYEKGFDGKKLLAMGYGNQYPVADNATEEGRRQNRRVELLVIGKDSEKEFDVYDTLGDFYDSEYFPTNGNTDDVLFPDSDQTTGGEEEDAAGPADNVHTNVSPYGQ